ncbi:DUF4157 domain-containing protein [Reinekea sp. G2M2-21]|uniref:eCIS core domain-containing protein n=1 Tax=Reinekea sp. G2M2-21 TaxID=2788942 RepID=UPI001E28B73B|nr:DUF4157 domain-containing protein [Reinekea sp. G2M2-21]
MKSPQEKIASANHGRKEPTIRAAQLAAFTDNRLAMQRVAQLQYLATTSGGSGIVQTQTVDTVQRQPEEEELLQGKFDSTSSDGTQAVHQRKPNATGLPDNLKSGMETLSGTSLDHVKVHYNSSKPAAVNAHAYAQGSDIHLAAGQEQHLPHELGHVVQQMQGRVKPTMNVNGVEVNDDAGLESEATQMGEAALQRAAIQAMSSLEKGET